MFRAAFSTRAGPSGVWQGEDTPMLLRAFEHIVRNVLLNWWESTAAARVP
jgi:hypothetical protein